MPTYNHGQYIANAINSILLQSYKNLELIIIDDGSEDNTEEVVKRFNDKRIRYFKHSHMGMIRARNLANEIARGNVIMFQDADDISMPDRIERCIDLFLKYDVVYHGLYHNAWSEMECMARVYVQAEKFDKKRLLKEQYIPGACLFKKELWERKPFRIDTQDAFDWMMHLDWVYSGAKYINLDVGLYEYVRTMNSISQTNESSGRRVEAIKKIKEIMKNEYKAKI